MSVLEVVAIQQGPNKTYQDSCAGQAECSLPQTACAGTNQCFKQQGISVTVRSSFAVLTLDQLALQTAQSFPASHQQEGVCPTTACPGDEI